MNDTIQARIAAFRREMAAAEIDAAIIYHTDPQQRGTLVITPDEALLWTDSRYFLQADRQLEGTGITLMKDGLTSTPSIEEHLISRLPSGSTVGIDGMLLSVQAASSPMPQPKGATPPSSRPSTR